MSRRRPSDRRTRRTGQALVEFAIVVPIFLTMLFGMIDLGRVVWANDSLANAAREAARFAIVHGGSETTACPVGPAPSTLKLPTASPSCPYPSPSKQAIMDIARASAVASGADVTVTVCYGAGCSGNTDTATNVRGTPITVTVSSTVGLITGALVGRSSYTPTGLSTMIVNH